MQNVAYCMVVFMSIHNPNRPFIFKKLHRIQGYKHVLLFSVQDMLQICNCWRLKMTIWHYGQKDISNEFMASGSCLWRR